MEWQDFWAKVDNEMKQKVAVHEAAVAQERSALQTQITQARAQGACRMRAHIDFEENRKALLNKGFGIRWHENTKEWMVEFPTSIIDY